MAERGSITAEPSAEFSSAFCRRLWRRRVSDELLLPASSACVMVQRIGQTSPCWPVPPLAASPRCTLSKRSGRS